MSIRIDNLEETQRLQNDDYFAIDSEARGTKKINASKLGINDNIAPVYSASATYNKGEIVLYNGDTYGKWVRRQL